MEIDDVKSPYEGLMFEEAKTIVYSFCTLLSLIRNKKLNFQHVFGILLTEEKYRNFLKAMLDEDNDIMLYKTLLAIEPGIVSSKYIFKLCKANNANK